MEQRIVSTAYAPLQPPYQIIKYDQDVAMQIGTLIVTVQKGGKDYQIETHSHPVVAYENKHKDGLINEQLSDHQMLEGAVWNNVEVRDVTTICLAGSTLTWQQFIDVLDYSSFMHRYRTAPDIDIYWGLKRLGVTILPPEVHECTIPLALMPQPEECGLSFQSDRSDSLFLNVSVAEDDKDEGLISFNHDTHSWQSTVWKEGILVWQALSRQLYAYQRVLRDLLFDADFARFSVKYTTEMEQYQTVIDGLNDTFSDLAYLS